MDTVYTNQLLDLARTQAESDVRRDILSNANIDTYDNDDDDTCLDGGGGGDVAITSLDAETLAENGFVRAEFTETSTIAGKAVSAAVTIRYSRRRQLDPPREPQTFARRCTLVMHSVNAAKTHNIKKLCEAENSDDK